MSVLTSSQTSASQQKKSNSTGRFAAVLIAACAAVAGATAGVNVDFEHAAPADVSALEARVKSASGSESERLRMMSAADMRVRACDQLTGDLLDDRDAVAAPKPRLAAPPRDLEGSVEGSIPPPQLAKGIVSWLGYVLFTCLLIGSLALAFDTITVWNLAKQNVWGRQITGSPSFSLVASQGSDGTYYGAPTSVITLSNHEQVTIPSLKDMWAMKFDHANVETWKNNAVAAKILELKKIQATGPGVACFGGINDCLWEKAISAKDANFAGGNPAFDTNTTGFGTQRLLPFGILPIVLSYSSLVFCLTDIRKRNCSKSEPCLQSSVVCVACPCRVLHCLFCGGVVGCLERIQEGIEIASRALFQLHHYLFKCAPGGACSGCAMCCSKCNMSLKFYAVLISCFACCAWVYLDVSQETVIMNMTHVDDATFAAHMYANPLVKALLVPATFFVLNLKGKKDFEGFKKDKKGAGHPASFMFFVGKLFMLVRLVVGMGAAEKLPFGTYLAAWISNELALIVIQFLAAVTIFRNFKMQARTAKLSEVKTVVLCGLFIDAVKTFAAYEAMTNPNFTNLFMNDSLAHVVGPCACIGNFFNALYPMGGVWGLAVFAFVHLAMDVLQALITTFTMTLGALLGCKENPLRKKQLVCFSMAVYECHCDPESIKKSDQDPGCHNHRCANCGCCPTGFDPCIGCVYAFEVLWAQGAILPDFCSESLEGDDVQAKENVKETIAHLRGEPRDDSWCYNSCCSPDAAPFFGCGMLQIACCNKLKKPEHEEVMGKSVDTVSEERSLFMLLLGNVLSLCCCQLCSDVESVNIQNVPATHVVINRSNIQNVPEKPTKPTPAYIDHGML